MTIADSITASSVFLSINGAPLWIGALHHEVLRIELSGKTPASGRIQQDLPPIL
jgi:hypothetical protein